MNNENNNQYNNEARENHEDSPVMAREDHITDRRIINIDRSTEILMEENRYRIVKL